jgi:hypothetical protein
MIVIGYEKINAEGEVQDVIFEEHLDPNEANEAMLRLRVQEVDNAELQYFFYGERQSPDDYIHIATVDKNTPIPEAPE